MAGGAHRRCRRHQGNLILLIIGLGIAIPIIIAGAALIMALLDRLPILVWIGAALLGWAAGEAIVTDKAVGAALTDAFSASAVRGLQWATSGAGAVLVLIIAHCGDAMLPKSRP